MKKITLYTLLYLSAPCVVFGSDYCPFEAQRGLQAAFAAGDEERANFWLNMISRNGGLPNELQGQGPAQDDEAASAALAKALMDQEEARISHEEAVRRAGIQAIVEADAAALAEEEHQRLLAEAERIVAEQERELLLAEEQAREAARVYEEAERIVAEQEKALRLAEEQEQTDAFFAAEEAARAAEEEERNRLNAEAEAQTAAFFQAEDRERLQAILARQEAEARTAAFFAAEEDANLANRLYMEELAAQYGGHGYVAAPAPAPVHEVAPEPMDFSQADRTQLSFLMQTSAAFNDTDVHPYNLTVVRPHSAGLLEIGARALNANTNIPTATIFAEMRQVIARDGDRTNNAEAAIAQLEGHIAANPIDAETGIHVPHLLSSLWDLSRRYNDEFGFRDQQDENATNSIQQMLVHGSMPEGLQTEGGCYEGYAGRFFRDYLQLLNILANE